MRSGREGELREPELRVKRGILRTRGLVLKIEVVGVGVEAREGAGVRATQEAGARVGRN